MQITQADVDEVLKIALLVTIVGFYVFTIFSAVFMLSSPLWAKTREDREMWKAGLAPLIVAVLITLILWYASLPSGRQ